MSVITKVSSFISLFKKAIKGGEQEYTSGSIDRAIFLLSVPMIFEMSMEAIFAIVDVYFVGRLHDNDAISVIGLTESVLALIYSLAMGLSMAATAMVARRVGEKDIKSAEIAAAQAIYIGLAMAALISIVGIFFSENILRLMGGSETLIANNVGYTRWMLTGNVTIMLLFIINAVFRGAGDASLAMRSLLLANILNIVLDPIFIFGLGPIPAFGVEGAAIATNIGRGIGVMYQLYHLLKAKGIIKLRAENLMVDLSIIGRLLKISAGSTGQFLIGSASWIFLMRIMSDFGSAAQAGYTIAIRVIVFAILPAWGMANASATLVGQNLGAGHPDRAEKSVWRAAFFNMIFLALVTILFFSLATPILHFFTTDEVVLKNGIQCLQIVSLGYIFYAYGMVINQSFNGAGDTRTPIIISFFGFWIFQIPFAYILAMWFHTGPVGVYAAIAIAESLMALAGIFIFRQGKWKAVKV
ncbi:MATE family efflux transporter [Ohtaekwangia koreensis]|uniref:Multidrug-efflux transporter n=1 Tax=Ohtaekwangia koreensis TaxID=688867 RepID=A0A1T5MN54_9BACT|nr:MATE family efflux transporter [Ohtaekwangia koreensis]SKC89338.1 putative efflux protein, MATE family [Ohtaekwangia koreensis]